MPIKQKAETAIQGYFVRCNLCHITKVDAAHAPGHNVNSGEDLKQTAVPGHNAEGILGAVKIHREVMADMLDGLLGRRNRRFFRALGVRLQFLSLCRSDFCLALPRELVRGFY